MDRGAWQTTDHGVMEESDTTEWLNHCTRHKKPGKIKMLPHVSNNLINSPLANEYIMDKSEKSYTHALETCGGFRTP